MLSEHDLFVLESFIKEILLGEAKKKRKKKTKTKTKTKTKKKNKRPGRKDYYKKLNRKGKLEMAREINKCDGKGKGKNWKRPASCYNKEWEADKEKYRSKK